MGEVLDTPDIEAIRLMSAGEHIQLLQQLLQAEREVAVCKAQLVGAVKASGEFALDGHRNIDAWYRAISDDDPDGTNAVLGLTRLLRGMPTVADALNAGSMTLAQARVLAASHRNVRARDALHDMEAEILQEADVTDLVEFTRTVRNFVELVDADGAARKAEATHERRRAHLSEVGDGFRGDFGCGAAQGVVIKKVLDAFTDREFHADCAEAKARLGERYTAADLARTTSQRRMDALYAIHVAAAAHQAGDKTPEPLINLMVDHRTATEIVEHAATGVRPTPDLTNLRGRRCETTDGVPIPRSDVLAAMLTGRIRRVIVDGLGVTIDLGRKQRLWRGNARDAVIMRNTTCVWAGCHIAASNCQADHLDPYAAGGETNADSGCPCCGKHNRFKTRGFTTRQDEHGRWHTLRPDGTNINSPPAA
jgi:hypothetical protein